MVACSYRYYIANNCISKITKFINFKEDQIMKEIQKLQQATEELIRKIDGMMLRYKNGYLEKGVKA